MEIIIVIIILGVIAGLALPNISFSIEKSKSAEGVQILTALLGGQRAFAIDHNGTYTTDTNQLDVTVPRSDNFNTPILRDGSSGVLAEISSRNNHYELSINPAGHIGCTDDSGGSYCSRLGYR